MKRRFILASLVTFALGSASAASTTQARFDALTDHIKADMLRDPARAAIEAVEGEKWASTIVSP